MATLPKTFLTPAEYLAIEREAEFKSEFVDGEMWAMSGTKLPHSALATDLLFILGGQLKGTDCQTFNNDLRVVLPTLDQYFYPDATVVCGTPQLQDDMQDCLLNPILVAEVLSPSTEAYDRGRKWVAYRTIPSLQYYLLLAQDRAQAELYTRAEDKWVFQVVNGLAGVLTLDRIGCSLQLSDLYARITLA